MPDNVSENFTWESITPKVDVLLRPDASNDIVALLAFISLGSALESAADAGVMSFTGRMLQRGTKKKSNAQLAESIDSLGISLSCDIGADYSNLNLVCTTDTLDESLTLLSEFFFEPSFEPEEIEKERQSTLAAIRRGEDDLFGLTVEEFYKQLYPNHGYGLPGLGTAQSVGEFTRAQMINVHEELTAGPYRIVAVGNFDPETLKAQLKALFADRLNLSAELPIQPARPLPAFPPAEITSLTRESEQAYLVMGFPALEPTHPHYYAARVLNAILGEGMSSRLFASLREEKGLAYATGSSYSAQKLAGQVFGYIGTKPESLETARVGMLAEFEKIKTELVPEEEFERARNYLVGKFLIDHQKNFRRAFYLGHFDQIGLGAEMDLHYPEKLAAVTREQVQDVARELLNNPLTVQLVPKG